MSIVINNNGKELDFDAAANYMDDDIFYRLRQQIAPCPEQEFFTAYEAAHAAEYGEEWELSKANPVW